MQQLLKDFYTITEITLLENKIDATLLLNENHSIYQGHFPEIPIVPGVCQMQIIRELLSIGTNKKLRLISADNMKFLAMINPKSNKILGVKIDFKNTSEKSLKVSGNFYFEQQIFFKFSGSFEILEL